jgi:molybdenum cofactor cytidylyltransferase
LVIISVFLVFENDWRYKARRYGAFFGFGRAGLTKQKQDRQAVVMLWIKAVERMEDPKIGIAILAAGASSRMGQPKQLLRIEGESLLRRCLRTALRTPFRPIVVVLGAHAALIAPELAGEPVLIAHNEDWAAGMGGSVATGLEALLAADAGLEAAFFLLPDQPYLDAQLLLDMAAALKQQPEKLGAAAAYAGTLGVPALLREALFPELLRLRGQPGAKPLIHKHQSALCALPFPRGQFDLDTPEDWQAFLGGKENEVKG